MNYAMMNKKGCTSRQARLVDWLRRPTGLPDHPAIDPAAATWTAAEIVDRSGLYDSRRACLADLNALRDTGTVIRSGDRWRYRRHHEQEL